MKRATEDDRSAPARPVRVMTLRRDGTCRDCGATLLAGTRAAWDPAAMTTTCAACIGDPAGPTEIVWVTGTATTPTGRRRTDEAPPDPGVAGASAQRVYEQRRDRRETEVRTAHPTIGGLLLALTDEPRSTTAWATGAAGERKLGEALDALRADDVVVLHDRRIPRSSANIDHLVVAPSGIHVIDAKRYKGRISIRASGSIFRPGPSHLFVGGRNKHQLVVAAQRQAEVVRSTIADLVDPGELDDLVRPALCFIDGDWSWFAKPEVLDGVGIAGPKGVAGWITEPGPLAHDQVLALGVRLAQTLPRA